MPLSLDALDRALFERITPLVSKAIAIGGDTFLALKAAVEDSHDESELLACNGKAKRLIERVQNELSDLLRAHVLNPQ